MVIKILGTGCKKCSDLALNAKRAVDQLATDVVIEKVEDIQEIMRYGVMQTPALVVDDVVKSYGKVLSSDEIIKLVRK